MNWAFHAGSRVFGEFEAWKHRVPNKSLRWEHGPGIYLSKDYYTIQNYIKGRSLWLVLWEGTHIEQAPDLDKNLHTVLAFLDILPKYSETRIRDRLTEYCRRDYNIHGKVPLFVFLNIIINLVAEDRRAFPIGKTPELGEFLTRCGGDWGGELHKVCTIWNPAAIKHVFKTPPKMKYWNVSDTLQFILDKGVTL